MDWPNISDQEKAEAQARLDALRAGREDPQTQKWSESELMRVNGIPCVYTFWFGKYHVHLPGMPDALSLEHLIAYGYRAELPDKPRKATTAEMAERKQFRMRSEECSKKLNLVAA